MAQSPEEIRREIERTREDLGETMQAIGERVSPGRIVHRRKERVRNRFTSVREAVMGSAQDAYGAAGGRVSSASDSARQAARGMAETTGSMVDQVREAPELARRQTQGNPLAAGVIAFGGGVLLASLLPPSEREQQAAQALTERLEPVKEHAREAAEEVKAGVTDAASQAAEQVKQQASQAAESVKGEAQAAAQDVKSQGQSSAEAVRQAGSPSGS